MNGSEKMIYDAVKNNGKHISKLYTRMVALEVTQKLQHEDNRKDIEVITKAIKGYSKLKGQIIAQWFLIAVLIYWVFNATS